MKTELIEKLSVLSTGAFGLVAALAWNSAIQAIFKEIFGDQSSIPAMISYAVIVTALAVLVTLWISRIAEKAKKAEIRSLFRKKSVQQAVAKEIVKEATK